MARGSTTRKARTETYQHPEADLALRPEVETQPQFRKRGPPTTYRYDSSLSPSLEWDGKNPVREQGEWLLALIDEAAKLPGAEEFDQPRIFRRDDGTVIATCRGLRDAIDQLRRLGKPFLNWAGKAERLSFDVPTLPLFVHERLSTMAIVETLKDHTKEGSRPATRYVRPSEERDAQSSGLSRRRGRHRRSGRRRIERKFPAIVSTRHDNKRQA